MKYKRVRLSDQEVNTILAALRTYQAAGYGDPFARPDDIHEIATRGDEQISMDDEGINSLCERINCHAWLP